MSFEDGKMNMKAQLFKSGCTYLLAKRQCMFELKVPIHHY